MAQAYAVPFKNRWRARCGFVDGIAGIFNTGHADRLSGHACHLSNMETAGLAKNCEGGGVFNIDGLCRGQGAFRTLHFICRLVSGRGAGRVFQADRATNGTTQRLGQIACVGIGDFLVIVRTIRATPLRSWSVLLKTSARPTLPGAACFSVANRTPRPPLTRKRTDTSAKNSHLLLINRNPSLGLLC